MDGDLSTILTGDCKLFRIKSLSISLHKEPMGGGTGKSFTTTIMTGNIPILTHQLNKSKIVCSR